MLIFYMGSGRAICASSSAWASLGGQLSCYVCVYTLWDTHTAFLRSLLPKETKATSVELGCRYLLSLRAHLAMLWQWEGIIQSQVPTLSDQVLLDIPREQTLKFDTKLILVKQRGGDQWHRGSPCEERPGLLQFQLALANPLQGTAEPLRQDSGTSVKAWIRKHKIHCMAVRNKDKKSEKQPFKHQRKKKRRRCSWHRAEILLQPLERTLLEQTDIHTAAMEDPCQS